MASVIWKSIPIEVARQARAAGFEGLKVPQVAGNTGAVKIVLFPDKFHPGSYIKRLDGVDLNENGF